MSSHIGRAYLNTCLKVPIDPCNNCPAPTYSRPKLYMGRSTVTPTNTCSNADDIGKNCSSLERGPKWSCGGIRSLAKLYDSIPDYRDLHHLSGEEFYSTLDTLRSTCRELKVKTSCLSSEDRCSIATTTTTSSSLTSNSQLGGSRSKKCKKSKKKKKSNGNLNSVKCVEAQESGFMQEFLNTQKQESVLTKPRNYSLTKSSKKDLEEEVECFKKSLKEFEEEFKRPLSSLNRNESRSFTRSSSKEFCSKTQEDNKKTTEKVPVRSTFTSQLRERLRKSLSFNDLHSLTEPLELIELRKKNTTLEHLTFKGDSEGLQDPSKLSNYFPEKSKSDITGIPKIVVDSPTSDQSSDRLQGKKKSKQKSNKKEEYKMPFSIFDLDSSSKKEGSIKHSTPSPVHPVARPNLAATLRVESSKKKVKELKNNCTYHDTTPQVDWEVRKTPAWKTLSFNETHKEILQLRLATRKAEQALQKREYELNMELMRQRVKSAPLLLEGPTYWGPHVGKLSHACQKEGRRHMCQSNQQRSRRKKHTSRSLNCRRSGILTPSLALEGEHFDTATNTYRVQTESRAGMSQKLNTLRKIYGGSGGGNGTKSQSRNSNHSTNTQQSVKSQKKRSTSRMQRNEEKSCKSEVNYGKVELDSADELSSLDRAFL